jgi:hypothetical protein
MASDTDISNLALARLGDEATVASIDPPEGSAQAEHCARFFPIARDSLLEMHAWKFATRRALLVKRAESSWNWRYAYSAPSDALRILSVLPADGDSDDDTQAYDVEGDALGGVLILSNLDDASVRYTVGVKDTSRFPPLFVDALAWLLASHLAGPVLKGEAGAAMAKSCYQHFLATYGRAVESDANQRKVQPEHTPAWVAGR